jgi:hypothetical protein
MPRIITAGMWTLGSIAVLAMSAQADVVIRGPFGRQVVVPAPVEVRVGPGVMVAPGKVVYPAPALPAPSREPVIVSKPAPVVRPDMEGDTLPPPKVLAPGPGVGGLPVPVPAVVTPILPRDFAKSFRPAPGNYEVTFLHPINRKPVTVDFSLPPGNPRVSYCCNSLRFDYGRHDVEIRFQLGGRVRVTQR